jgi:hypothetical protein
MKKSHTQITHLNDTHAVVAYNFGMDDKYFEGWVRLDPTQNRVIARLHKGRNEFHLCNVTDVVAVQEVTL